MKFNLIENNNKKIGIFTDLHCGVEKDSTERLAETKVCIDWIINTFKENKVDWIFFLGDFFDSRFSINTKSLNTGIDCIEKLANNFEKVFIILGNHDAFYKNTNEVNSIEFFEKISPKNNIKIISTEPYYIKLIDKTLALYPWASENLLLDEEKVKNIETCDFAFGHFEANGFKQPGGISKNSKTNFTDLFKFGNYIFSGHYHINKLYINPKNPNNKLLMVGSPLQLNWSDYNLEKNIYILDIINNSLNDFSNNINAKYEKIYFSKLEENKYKKDDLVKLCHKNYIKLVIDTKNEFNTIVKFSTQLKEYMPRSLEIEYLISLTSNLIAKSTDELSKASNKTNLDYLLEYIDNVYEEVKKIDTDINIDTLIDLTKSYYNKVTEN